jgi:hypothetical protein
MLVIFVLIVVIMAGMRTDTVTAVRQENRV